MGGEPVEQIKVFYSYAREDEALRDQLERHMSVEKLFSGRHGLRYKLICWHDRKILPGEVWQEAINEFIETADIILPLISPHFFASDYCYGVEMQRALERQQTENCSIIPIFLRPVHYENTPFSSLKALPSNQKPITLWKDRDAAFYEVMKGIRDCVHSIIDSKKSKDQWFREGNAYFTLGEYSRAIEAFEHAINIDPTDAVLHNNVGNALRLHGMYVRALKTYETAISLDPNYAIAFNGKGFTLYNLKQYDEALIAYEQAITLDPNYARAYYNIGLTLQKLEKALEAKQAFEKALELGFVGIYD